MSKKENKEIEKEKSPRISVGYRTGNLIVLGKADTRKNGYIVWKCLCECGGMIELDTRYLQRGAVKDCGCLKRKEQEEKDLTGKQFGQLFCREKTEEQDKNEGSIWRCRCNCGEECLVSYKKLTHGLKRSCGCWKRPTIKDFVGKNFGDLTVIEYAGKQNGMHRWECQCVCGNKTIVGQTLLQTGKTSSCGCRKVKSTTKNLKLCEGTSILMLESSRKGRSRNNTSGYTGVYLNKKTGKWIAQITFKKKTYYLGTFERKEDAIKMRKKGEEMHQEFIDWYYKNQ